MAILENEETINNKTKNAAKAVAAALAGGTLGVITSAATVVNTAGVVIDNVAGAVDNVFSTVTSDDESGVSHFVGNVTAVALTAASVVVAGGVPAIVSLVAGGAIVAAVAVVVGSSIETVQTIVEENNKKQEEQKLDLIDRDVINSDLDGFQSTTSIHKSNPLTM